jgi:HEAT repeat protein
MDTQKLIQQLSDPDESERLFAADDLGMSNDPAAVDPLAARLSAETSRAVREMIILALRHLQTDAVLDQAIRLLSSEDPFIRNEMASLLQSRGESAIPWLEKALTHADPDVRKLTLEAAAQIPGAHARRFLEASLSDPDPNLVMSAVENLRAEDVRSFQARLEAMALASSSPMLTVACIEALGMAGSWPGLDAFLRAFADRPELRYSLISAVGSAGGSRHLSFLQKSAENSACRLEIVNALLKLADRGAFTELDSAWLHALASWARAEPSSPLTQDSILLLEKISRQPAALALAAELRAETPPGK